jgi:L-2-hydroxycarboxylate dehydrogenase (NAD+)
MEKKLVDARRLTQFASSVLEKLGVPPADAAISADAIVAADLRGVESHGTAHLAQFYVQRIQKGFINIHPQITITSQAPATALIDGDNGIGFVVGHYAMKEAIQRARNVGVGLVAVRNSTHFGACAYYSMMALPYDMIGVAMSSTGPIVYPPGSKARGVGTNPISLAVPAGRETPFVLDMATSVVAGGKVSEVMRKGLSLPMGWAVDNQGQITTDPKAVFAGGGGLLPLGGTPELGVYKGFALAVAVEILCNILSGSVAGLLQTVTPGAAGNKCDHFFAAIRIDGFLPVETFKAKMDNLIQAYHALPKAEGVENIFLAGEMEAETERLRRAEGIPLHEKVASSLQEISAQLGIPYDL